jgi:hypothetical protein
MTFQDVTVTEDDKLKILDLLILHVKYYPGQAGAVWCDGSIPRIRYGQWDEITPLSWTEAADLVGFKLGTERKPVRNELRSEHPWRTSVLSRYAK